MSVFEEFGKIARLTRNCVITEKIDGTNAQVYIEEISEARAGVALVDTELAIVGRLSLRAGSRNRWITPEADNFGFAAWVKAHAEELAQLGPGRHFGEWWGSGIQRGYGLQKGEKRFSLFNTSRWADDRDRAKFPQDRPRCCSVVPVVYSGLFFASVVEDAVEMLRRSGSMAAPGFANAEGVIVYHEAARMYFKKTLEKDSEPKGAAA